MKLNEIKKLLRHTKVEDIEVDAGELIAHDEFNNPAKGKGSYRERAIKRLLQLRLKFVSNFNCIHEMAKQFIKVRCPYCGRNMEPQGGGGTGDLHTVQFSCKCSARVHLTVTTDGIYVVPPVK